MKIQPPASVSGVRPEIVLALLILDGLFKARNLEAVISSCRDRVHGVGSFHYLGLAVDIKTKHLWVDELEMNRAVYLRRICDEIRAVLGPQFDVILEYVNAAQEHIHIEFQPKTQD